ncbi:MAG: hypothetical protein AABX16_03895 [Nanoarchaeota archaeon]
MNTEHFKPVEGTWLRLITTFCIMLIIGGAFMLSIFFLNGYNFNLDDTSQAIGFSAVIALLLTISVHKSLKFLLIFVLIAFPIFLLSIIFFAGGTGFNLSSEEISYIILGGGYLLIMTVIIYFIGLLIFRPIFNKVYNKY